jgi:hypothetical protein
MTISFLQLILHFIFSEGVSRCIAEWSKKAAECKGDIECLNECTKQLRGCLDSIFPYSKSIELETDKVNYIPWQFIMNYS